MSLRPCATPRCPVLVPKGHCPQHARENERRRYNSETRKWYSTDAWRVLRLIVLGDNPLCVDCRLAPSTEVDHITPHRGNYALFWDRTNLQGLCHPCHGRKTQRGE